MGSAEWDIRVGKPGLLGWALDTLDTLPSGSSTHVDSGLRRRVHVLSLMTPSGSRNMVVRARVSLGNMVVRFVRRFRKAMRLRGYDALLPLRSPRYKRSIPLWPLECICIIVDTIDFHVSFLVVLGFSGSAVHD